MKLDPLDNNEFLVPLQILLSRPITYYVIVAVDRPMFTIVYIGYCMHVG